MGIVRGLLRGITYILLLLLVPIIVIGTWVHQEVLQTDRYVETVAPLASDPVIQNQIHDEIMQFFDDVNAGEYSMDPEDLATYQAEYPPLRDDLSAAVTSAVQSDRFPPIWNEAMRASHNALVAVLTGEETTVATTSNGTVTIDLQPVFEDVNAQLNARGITVLNSIVLAPDQAQMTIFQSDDLARAQNWVEWFDRGIWALAAAMLLAGVFYFLLSKRKDRAIIWIGFALAAGAGLTWAAVQYGESLTVGSISDPGRQAAAEQIYETVLDPMQQNVIVIGLIGLLALLATVLINRVKPRQSPSLARR